MFAWVSHLKVPSGPRIWTSRQFFPRLQSRVSSSVLWNYSLLARGSYPSLEHGWGGRVGGGKGRRRRRGEEGGFGVGRGHISCKCCSAPSTALLVLGNPHHKGPIDNSVEADMASSPSSLPAQPCASNPDCQEQGCSDPSALLWEEVQKYAELGSSGGDSLYFYLSLARCPMYGIGLIIILGS